MNAVVSHDRIVSRPSDARLRIFKPFTPRLSRRGENRAPSPAGVAPIEGRRGVRMATKRRTATSDKEQPEWVPDVVWNEYQKLKAYVLIATPGTRDWAASETRLLRKLILDEACKGVWPVIHPETVYEEDVMSVYRKENLSRDLLIVISTALNGPSSDAKVSKSARSNRWGDVAKLADKLRQKLQGAARNDEVPVEITRALAACLHSAYQAYKVEDLTVPSIVRNSRDYSDKAMAQFVVSDLFMNERCDILAALSISATAWTATKPVKKTKAGDSKMPHLVLALTNYFIKTKGQPYRDQVAALTNCVMDTPAQHWITGDYVGRLAPVKMAVTPMRKAHQKLPSPASRKTPKK